MQVKIKLLLLGGDLGLLSLCLATGCYIHGGKASLLYSSTAPLGFSAS